jgi:hypothetical protein
MQANLICMQATISVGSVMYIWLPTIYLGKVPASAQGWGLAGGGGCHEIQHLIVQHNFIVLLFLSPPSSER